MTLTVVVLIAAALASGSAPQQQPEPASKQGARATIQPPTVVQQPSAGGSKNSGCPETSEPQSSCDAVTAKATERQAGLMADGNWLSLFTVLVAGAAAFFAAKAARAGIKSYEAFVAAEDASLIVEFEPAVIIPTTEDGKTSKLCRIRPTFVNVGRSTARLNVLIYNNKPTGLMETLKRDESWTSELPILVDASLESFGVRVVYGSPIHQIMTLDLTVAIGTSEWFPGKAFFTVGPSRVSYPTKRKWYQRRRA